MSDFLESAKGILATVAPSLATALGGPLAGMAVQAISAALLGNEDGTPEQVAAAIQKASPDQLLALKRAEQEFAVKMRELDIDLERIAASDRDSARRREADTKDNTTRVLAYVLIGAFIAMCVAVLAGWSQADSVMAGTLIGYLSAKAEQVTAYYFGSSASSQRKTDLLGKIQGKG